MFMLQLPNSTNYTNEMFSVFYLAESAFISKKDYGREDNEAQWAHARWTFNGIHAPKIFLFGEKRNY